MKKELFTVENVKSDLNQALTDQSMGRSDYKFACILLGIALGIVFIVFLKKVMLLCIPCFVFSGVFIFLLVKQLVEDGKVVREIKKCIDQEDFSVSIKKLSHITYEPNTTVTNKHGLNKTDEYFYFEGGVSWRVPEVIKHYDWSTSYSFGQRGLNDSSVKGDEFYYITLKNNPEIGYVYNTRLFIFLEYKEYAEE